MFVISAALSRFSIFCIFSLFVCFNSVLVEGKDIVRMNTGNQSNDLRVLYKMKVLETALDRTTEEFGLYEIKINEIPTTAKRALREVYLGKTINLFIGVTTREWEQKNLPIRIPIRRGILSYRLLATNKNNLANFSQVNDIEALKKLSVGLRVGWATTDVFKKQNFKHYELESLDGLYHMLNRNAVDYMPRGINEIYDEIAVRQPNDIAIEPHLALYLPAPTYVIVSPHEKRLAKRIEKGLETMISDGSLKALFYQFYADDIKKAKIFNRNVIRIDNPDQPEHIPFNRAELWFLNDKELQAD
jgi:hypothetical protein